MLLTIREYVIGWLASPRDTEPRSVCVGRAVLLNLIRLGLLGYLFCLILDFNEGGINVTFKRDPVRGIAVPNLYFQVRSDQTTTCMVLRTNIIGGFDNDVFINTSIVQDSIVIELVDNYVIRKFDGQSYRFTDPNDKASDQTDGVLCITELVNATKDEENEDIVTYMYAFHPESDLFNASFVESINKISEGTDVTDFNSSLLFSNEYVLSTQQVNVLNVRENKREVFLKSSITTFVGYRDKKRALTYIATTFTSINLAGIPIPPSGAAVMVLPQEFMVITESERPSSTVLDILNQLGGMGGLVFFLYAFLLGNDATGPWGFVQICCLRGRTRQKLAETLPRYPPPFSNHADGDDLRERVRGLERFMKDYVVDVSLVEDIRGLHTFKSEKAQLAT